MLLTLAHVVCLCGNLLATAGQQIGDNGNLQKSTSTGEIAGRLWDPSGAVIVGAAVDVRSPASNFRKSLTTDEQGFFQSGPVPAGRYEVTIRARGFGIAVLPDVAVRDGNQAIVELTLKVEGARTEIEVVSAGDLGSERPTLQEEEQRSRNAAELLQNQPGVSLRDSGQLASIPLLHGLGDERTKLLVDGMTISPSCPNHMNPPLSYVAPADASEVSVLAGITPVSLGGDSLGGTIVIASRSPVFAGSRERVHEESSVSGFYRGNGANYGGVISEWVAGHNIGIGYSGTWVTGDDYTDGNGKTVKSTYAQSTDHTFTLAAQGRGNLFVLRAELHHTPYEGFVNAWMDIVRNYAMSVNLNYNRSLARGALDVRVFWQSTSHSMDLGRDKAGLPMAMPMPMNDHGADTGYSLQYEIPLTLRQTLRVGNELHRFVLNDTWPPVAGMAPAMGPESFVDINHGRRSRLGTFAEILSRWNAKWTTLIGGRNDTISSNAGPVQGYSGLYAADAAAFNASDRARMNVDVDATATVRYEPDPFTMFEVGYGRKSRAPNLYERYSWTTSMMASSMIGWFGDGNSYVGDVRLKPEIAHTVSGTATLHDRNRNLEVKATPYETHIQDYVDVNTLSTMMEGMSTFAELRFSNHPARIYGGDLSGTGTLWRGSRLGTGTLSGVGGWLHGDRLDSGTGLYQMMPLYLRMKFDEESRGWTAGLGMEAVDRKTNVDPYRFEQKTPGYTLFCSHIAYRRERLQANVAVDNLLNRYYVLPIGGVNIDQFLASGMMGSVAPVSGRGRSASVGMSFEF